MDVELLNKRLTRQIAAREEAERLLEEKSQELYEAHQSLKITADFLSAQSSQLSIILDKAPISVLLVNKEGDIIQANRMATVTFQSTTSQFIEKKLFDLFVNEDRQVVENYHNSLLASPTNETSFEAKAISSTTPYIPLEIFISSFEWGDGIHTLWLCRDLTKRQEKEHERLQIEQELRQAQKLEALGTLASGIAHEINTPIQFVSNNISFMEDSFNDLQDMVISVRKMLGAKEQDSSLESDFNDILEDVDYEFLAEEIPSCLKQSTEGMQRIGKIVSAIKDFSHPGTEEKSAVDINKAIETTATVSHNQWKYVADLEFDLDAKIPAVMAHSGDINQVFLNLIVNSAHAIEECGKDDKGKIVISTCQQGDMVEVRMADNGTGIDPDNLAQIYDPFFTTKEVGKGTGQGLSITQNIISLKHKGTVDVESTVGQGTTFIIRLPIVPPDTNEGGLRGLS